MFGRVLLHMRLCDGCWSCPDHHGRSAEPDVRADQQVDVVGPGTERRRDALPAASPPLPQVHRLFVPFQSPARRRLPRPARPFQQPPHNRHRYGHPETAVDHRLNPARGPPPTFEATGGRALAQFLLQHRKLGIRDPRHLHRPSGTQGLRTTLPPSSTSAFHRTLTHPHLLRDHHGFPTRCELPVGLSRTCSRITGRSAVRHPPSAYGIPPAYRRDHP